MSAMNTGKAFFIECYVNYRPLIYKIIYTKLGDRDSAEDICQEVFSRFFVNLHRIEIETAKRWLLAASRNVLYEHYRTLERTPENIDELTKLNDETLAYNTPDYDMEIIINDVKQSLHELDRHIFDYMVSRGCTYDETAERLGLTSRQVRYRLNLIHRYITEYFVRHGLKDISDFEEF
jgi:RNA polymerase sigma-70 factor (ECF subfamily)